MNDKLIKFLVEAKKVTYAGSGVKTTPTRFKSNDYEYIQDNKIYHDTYFGGSNFIGEEIVYVNEIPFWAMNYIGRATGDNFKIDFLKEALKNTSLEMPYRGPGSFKKDEYEYICEVNGDINWFQGKEIIMYNNEEIYESFFHGGLIK